MFYFIQVIYLNAKNYMYMKLQLYEILNIDVITKKSTHHTWLSEYLIDWLTTGCLTSIFASQGWRFAPLSLLRKEAHIVTLG